MTSNQLTLGRLREDTRHHKQEETLGFGTLAETKRHNVQQEGIGFGNIGLGYSSLAETKRHNIAQEAYQGDLALSQADLAAANTAKTKLDVAYYLDQLQVQKDKAEAALKTAASQEERVRIEQQLADIQEEMKAWNKFAIGAEGAKDIATGVFGSKGVVGGVQSVIQGGKSDERNGAQK